MRRFCSHCGAVLPGRPPATCSACGRRDWGNAKPGAAALVSRGGELLLVRRAHAPWRGLWCAPAGFCEGGEHPIATAEREAREEAGVHERVTGFLGIWICEYGDDEQPSEGELVSVAYYHATPLDEPGGEPDPGEVSEARWFAGEALPDELAPPQVLPAVLEAWRADLDVGRAATPLPDRPG